MSDKPLHDSGKRQDFESGCVRDTAGSKTRPDLISPYFADRVGAHLEKGASKYAERNWEQGMPISRCIASLERHLMQYKMGLTDEDHAAAISCNIIFIIHYEEMIKRGSLPAKLDDMPHYEQVGSVEQAEQTSDEPRYMRAGQLWEPYEDATLRSEVACGATVIEMAKDHQREEVAIFARLSLLGINYGFENDTADAEVDQAETNSAGNTHTITDVSNAEHSGLCQCNRCQTRRDEAGVPQDGKPEYQ